MINFIKNNPLKSFFFVVIILPLFIHGANKSVGFCFEKGRILSDEEMIEMTLDYYYKHEIKLAPSDTSVKAYIANHPKCCVINGREDLYYHGIGSLGYETVYISYPIREDALDRYAGAIYYKKWFAVNQCGRALEYSGFGSSTPD